MDADIAWEEKTTRGRRRSLADAVRTLPTAAHAELEECGLHVDLLSAGGRGGVKLGCHMQHQACAWPIHFP